MSELSLKIGRHTYQISSDDTFMDNGACVQLTSQSELANEWGGRPNPVLSKRAVKEISQFRRTQLQHGYGSKVQLFSLALWK